MVEYYLVVKKNKMNGKHIDTNRGKLSVRSKKGLERKNVTCFISLVNVSF